MRNVTVHRISGVHNAAARTELRFAAQAARHAPARVLPLVGVRGEDESESGAMASAGAGPSGCAHVHSDGDGRAIPKHVQLVYEEPRCSLLSMFNADTELTVMEWVRACPCWQAT